MTLGERIDNAEQRTNTNPTERQKLSGNYAKGKVTVKGFQIAIENPVGSVRSGISPNGDRWETEMKNSYGFFTRTLGHDGDPVDVFLGTDFSGDELYVVDQVDPKTRAFDEHKVMFGFTSIEDAKEAYLANYEPGWTGLGAITEVGMEVFRLWLNDYKTTKYPFNRYKNGTKYRNAQQPRTKSIKLEGEVEEDITLADLQKQAGDPNKFEILEVEILSPGGNVIEGLKIMQWLNDLSSEGKIVHTFVTANAYSIASMIMLVANKRFISKHGEVMVHDPMLPTLEYANATELETHAAELRELEALMRELYCAFTGLDEAQIQELMSQETYISPDDAVSYGFADEVVDLEKKKYVMVVKAAEKQKLINMSKTRNALARVIARVQNSDVVNQVYSTMEGPDVEIYQQDPSGYSIGDRTNIEQGEVQLADGTTLVIEDWVITDKKTDIEEKPAEEKPAEEKPAEELTEEELAAKKAEEAAAEEVPGTNVGPAPAKPEEEMTEEEKIAAGLIEKPAAECTEEEMKARIAAETDPEMKAKLEEEMRVALEKKKPSMEEHEREKMASDIEKEMAMKEEMMKTIQALQGEVKKLQATVSELQSEKLMTQVEQLGTKMQGFEKAIDGLNQDNEMVAQAIEALAEGTSSTWQPVARASAKVNKFEGKTIFQQMQARKKEREADKG